MASFLLFHLTLLCVLETILSQSTTYTNFWAVQVAGAPSEAQRLANKHGFTFVSQIFSDFYLYQHKKVEQRSQQASYHKHQQLIEEPNVLWLKQQPEKTYRLYSQSSPQLSFNDPRYSEEWYIDRKDGWNYNISVVWEQGITGKGVAVSVVDDGLDKNHLELKQNYHQAGSRDVVDGDENPGPDGNGHGDSCAGIIAGVANNDNCGVGLAYEAKIGGIRLIDKNKKGTDAQEAQALSFALDHIDIYSNSWGPGDVGSKVEGPGPLAQQALENGVTKGRNGNGAIYVFAAGNGGTWGDSCSYNGYVNNIHTIAISAVNKDGSIPFNVERCPGIMAVTYSTDKRDDVKVITAGKGGTCVDNFGYTSAAAAMASGLVALTLQANKDLSWRDMQHLIVVSARADNNHLKSDDWRENAKGYKVSDYFGFGLMNVGLMVHLAKTWKKVPQQYKCEVKKSGHWIIPGTGELKVEIKLEDWFTNCPGVTQIKYLEHVQVRVNLTYVPRGRLLIDLQSPEGTVSKLTHYRQMDVISREYNLTDWTFLTLHHWREKAIGTWQLSLRNSHPEDRPDSTGKLFYWALILYGTGTDPLEGNEVNTPIPPTPPTSGVFSTTSPSPITEKPSGSLSGGQIAGIAVGSLLCVAVVVIVVVVYKKLQN